jgi:hypothetical protein
VGNDENRLLTVIATLSNWLHARHVDIHGYIEQEGRIDEIRQKVASLNDVDLSLIAADLEKLSQSIVDERQKRKSKHEGA